LSVTRRDQHRCAPSSSSTSGYPEGNATPSGEAPARSRASTESGARRSVQNESTHARTASARGVRSPVLHIYRRSALDQKVHGRVTRSPGGQVKRRAVLRDAPIAGPVIVNRFGKPAIASPRYVCGPSFHFSASDWPPRPRIPRFFSGPVSASKPVAKTMMSSSCSLPPARMPFGVISSIGASLASTSRTLSLLKVS
jgi:hypothetical protein